MNSVEQKIARLRREIAERQAELDALTAKGSRKREPPRPKYPDDYHHVDAPCRCVWSIGNPQAGYWCADCGKRVYLQG